MREEASKGGGGGKQGVGGRGKQGGEGVREKCESEERIYRWKRRRKREIDLLGRL